MSQEERNRPRASEGNWSSLVLENSVGNQFGGQTGFGGSDAVVSWDHIWWVRAGREV